VSATRLEIAQCSLEDVIALQEELDVSAPLAQILVRRGLRDAAAARAFLDPREEHDAADFRGIDDAVKTILDHLSRRSPVTVHGDYDVDGVCSSAVLVRVLRQLGARVDWYLPDRAADGYGLNIGTVERLAARGTRLLITADCAITAVAEVAAARQAGMDVVVTDHHRPLADGSLPDAPIVHPAIGGYPCPDLCATAVAYKLALALCAAAGRDPTAVREDLDLVALATIADVVPLRGENRTLVRHGLRALATTAKPGLRALMAVARVNPGRLDERAIGFALCPRINAAGRLYRADAGLELLLTDDPVRAAQIADELDHANHERRLTETRILFEAEAQATEQGPAAAYVLAGEGWHPGVIGIVASRLVERHHRPVVCIAVEGERGRGSGRSIESFDLLGGLQACAPHLLRHGGHRAAAGLEIERGRVEAFRLAFTEHAERCLRPEDLVARQRVDAIVGGHELGLPLAEELGRLAPFGCANPIPALLVPAATPSDARPMGEGRHVRFTLQAGGCRSRAVGFGTGGRLPVGLDEPADVVCTLEVNDYQGTVEPRLVLRCAHACDPGPVRIVGEPEDYLPAVWAALDAPLPGEELAGAGAERRVREARGQGVAGTLRALQADSRPLLVVCADARRRREHLTGRLGGLDLCSYAALLGDPALAAGYTHVALLDPPACRPADTVTRAGRADQYVHLLWGESELRFAQRVHARDHDLRAPLRELYREIRNAGALVGPTLAAALAGHAAIPRPPLLAGRLLRVLAELELIEIDRRGESVAVRPARPTALERSAAFRAHSERLLEGCRLLGDGLSQAA
jgi:single-stranded-DNA-specific exonuclease